MVKSKKGNILMLTFILVMGLAMVVGSTTYLAVLRVRDIGGDMDYLNAYYYAQAGMAKAIWYLKNSGFGRRYRSTNLTESFGGGSYTINVKSGSTPLFVTITSKGTVRSTSRTIQAKYNTYPPAFNYPLYSLQKVTMESGTIYNPTYVSGASDICVLACDNVFVNKYANANGVAVTSGHSVTGEGSYFIRPLPAPLPSFPTLESTYYNNQINIAKAKSPGGKTYSFTVVNLGGGSVYWNGNVNVGTWAFVFGPGDLVASGTINVSDNAYISSKVRLIADKDLTVQDQASVGDCDVFYSNTKVTVITGFSDSSHVSLLCPQTVSVQNASNFYGIICAGSATLEASSLLMGSAMLGNFGNVNRMAGKARINYNVDYLPDFPPPGIPGTYTLIPGTWKEY